MTSFLDATNPEDRGQVEAWTAPTEKSIATVLESRGSRLAGIVGKSKTLQLALKKVVAAIDHYAQRNGVRLDDVTIDRVESHSGPGGFRIVIFCGRKTRIR